LIPYVNDVFGSVLAIRVSRDQSHQFWKRAQEVIYSGLERGAFSKVYGEAKQMNTSDLLDPAESFREFGAASVIDNNDRTSETLRQCPHQFNQRFLGPVRRNEDRKLGG